MIKINLQRYRRSWWTSQSLYWHSYTCDGRRIFYKWRSMLWNRMVYEHVQTGMEWAPTSLEQPDSMPTCPVYGEIW